MSQVQNPTVPPAAATEQCSVARARGKSEAAPQAQAGRPTDANCEPRIARFDASCQGRLAVQCQLQRKSGSPGGDSSVGIVIDTQNLASGAIEAGLGRIDIPKLIHALAAGHPWRCVACVAQPLNGASVDRFCRCLAHFGVDTAMWPSSLGGRHRKVDLDTLVVREAMRLMNSGVTELCLVAGDGDFWVIADECAVQGVRFTVAAVPCTLSGVLRCRAQRVVAIGPTYRLNQGEAA